MTAADIAKQQLPGIQASIKTLQNSESETEAKLTVLLAQQALLLSIINPAPAAVAAPAAPAATPAAH